MKTTMNDIDNQLLIIKQNQLELGLEIFMNKAREYSKLKNDVNGIYKLLAEVQELKERTK